MTMLSKYFGLGVIMFGLAVYFKHMRRWKIPASAEPYINLIKQVEKDYSLPNNLLVRLIEQESHFRADAHNIKSNAQGIAQIVPRWHPTVNNPFDPNEAIPYAGFYLRKLYNHYGYWDLTLAAYNWGRGNVSKLIDEHGANGFIHLPQETKNYVGSILADI